MTLNSLLAGGVRGSALALIMGAATIVAAHATPILNNGTFTQTTTGLSSQFGNSYPLDQVAYWNTTHLNYVFTPGSHVALGQFGFFSLSSAVTGSPGGGNFLALDGDSSYSGAVSTTVSGLTPGKQASVSFYYAGTEQAGYATPTSQFLDVSLGGQTLVTPTLSVAAGGFTGWTLETLNFDPTSATETLSFLANGSPNGAPPFTLLSDVGVSQVATTPEPSSLLLLGTGLLGAVGLVRSRRRVA